MYSVLSTVSSGRKGINISLFGCLCCSFFSEFTILLSAPSNLVVYVGCIFLSLDRPVAQSYADQPKNLTLDEGATARFTCRTIGNPPTQTHKWQFNGKDIPGESCSGCVTTTFVKTSVTLSDAGWYSCTGTNSLGEGPPAIAQLLIKCK